MSFFLFILVNATLFLRPGEIVPELLGLSIYESLIVGCFVLSLPEIMHYLTTGPWYGKPITCCVFGILGAILISQVASAGFAEAWRTGLFFLKVIIFYVLLVSVVNTPARVRRLVFFLVWFAALLTLVTILQYYQVIRLPTLRVLRDVDIDPTTGLQMYIYRLQGSGVFQDPNELCLMLAAVLPLCLYFLMNRQGGIRRIIWLVPLGLFLFAIALTKSRGGFLALVAGLGVIFWCRFGARRTLLIGALGLPVLLALGGRQTSISTSSGTGQSRIQVWNDWLYEFRHAPLFGTGMDLKEQEQRLQTAPEEEIKLAAHNSFLHSFTQLGLFGGMVFLAAFYIALVSLYQLRPGHALIADPEMARLYPFLFGTLAAFVVGMMSLSLCYVIPTYLILGLAVAYLRVTPHYSLVPPVRITFRVAVRVALVSFVFIVGMHVFVRLFINWA